MALVVKDRVLETTSTTGTGTLTLSGAVSGFQSFAAIGNGNTTYYTIYSGTDWEVGIGTYTSSGTTLSRDTVLASSAGGTTKISVVSGAQVFCTYPAGKSVDTDTAQTLTNKTLDGASNTFSNIGNSSLTNSSITINGSAISLGGSTSVGTVTSVSALTLGTTGTDLSSTVATGTTTPVITLNVPTASASNRGALSSTDWSTFNGKQAAYANLTTIGSLANGTGWLYNNGSGTFSYSTPTASDVGAVPTSRTVSTTSPLSGGGALSSDLTLSIPAATSSVNGYLTSTDWSTFNGKQAALSSGTNIKTVSGNSLLGSGDVGTIGVAYGGTGQTSYINGELLIGNTTGNTLTKATLTQGTGITITNGTGSITIANASPMTYPGAGIPNSTGSAWGTSYTTSGSGTVVALATGASLSGVTLNDGYTEEVYAVVDAAGVALSPTNGSIQTWTLGASRTPTSGTWNAGQSITLMINDGTAYTVTWTTLAVTWVGGSAPTLATTGFTVITLWKVGTTIYGSLVGSVA